jgi:membrane protein implicated in regulation of membrane protease activity
MEAYWVWWITAVVLVIAEMLSGTFYLLAVAAGMAAAGCAAYLGIAWSLQAAIAALLCTVSVAGVYRWRQLQTKSGGQNNFAYDIGENVQAVHWADARHARVSYRGAEWDAELADGVTSDAARQTWRIKRIVGSRLIIE